MPAPRNDLKAALAEGKMQIGLWLDLGSAAVAEIAAGAGFDWCLVDGEHGPYDIAAIRDQLVAIERRGCSAVVRVPANAEWMIKQVLDLGAQSVLVPMVDTPEQARAAVRAALYAPQGARGMGAAVARASNYAAIPDYVATANAEICVMVQAESRAALDNLDAIAATEGVDVVFIGPADLSADMGYRGQLDAPEVVAAIDDAIGRIRAAGKIAGIITFDPEEFTRCRDLGLTFLGVGGDMPVLATALRGLAADTRERLG
ncbi:MAG: HpcH/HpaI aldolase family protein [Paracoccaceae bacterium]